MRLSPKGDNWVKMRWRSAISILAHSALDNGPQAIVRLKRPQTRTAGSMRPVKQRPQGSDA